MSEDVVLRSVVEMKTTSVDNGHVFNGKTIAAKMVLHVMDVFFYQKHVVRILIDY